MVDDLKRLEARLALLEGQSLSDDERETLRFLIKVLKAIEGTWWLSKWALKIMPAIAAAWFFWELASGALLQFAGKVAPWLK